MNVPQSGDPAGETTPRGSDPSTTTDIADDDRPAWRRTTSRTAIVLAAAACWHERGGPHFTMEEVGERAGVSRRTVFNHFPSSNDLLLAIAGADLDRVIEQFCQELTISDHHGASPLEDVEHLLRSDDLPDAIVRLWQILDGVGGLRGGRRAQLLLAAGARAAARLTEELCERHPDEPPLDIELLATAATDGAAVIARHWLDGRTTDVTPELSGWDDLVDMLSVRIRAWYGTPRNL